ncbi:MAG: phosphotransferase [Actinobacteria bacterium]|nr:phosphotransferase [Actinomycetota bacterium]
MASTPLTLAALATSAVPGLNVRGTRSHTGDGDGAYSSAVLVTDDGDLIIRVPRTPNAEVRQSAELLGLAALAEGAREELPFAVPFTRGITRAGDTRAVVTTFIEGGRVDAGNVEADALLLQPVAEALAAIHSLPTSLVQQGGLPTRSAQEARVQALRLVERAAQTHLLPETVHRRWLDTLRSTSLWDFAPTVVHGSLTADQLIVTDDQIVGVLGWDALAAGDPATDLAWLLASSGDALDAVLARYSAIRGVTGMRELRARAHFYHQLEVARWLLHGVDTHDSVVVDDAVAMFDRLVDRLDRLGTPIPARSTLSGSEVAQLLDEVPDVPFDPRSETAEYEALDEDRMFHADTDFIEPVAVPTEGDAREPGETSEPGEAPASSDDQATQPIDPLEK